MKTYFDSTQLLHSPKNQLLDGKLVPAVEIPLRAESVLEQVKERKLGPIEKPTDFGIEPILRIHDKGYLEFLEGFWARWIADGREDEAFPYLWPIRGFRSDRVPSHIDGQLGFYSFDAGTPIDGNTYKAALVSVNTALSGTSEILRDNSSPVFSLCRPPGHHAAKDYFGGYCYLNNVAIAAQYLIDNGADRISILDIDYHHGNGTQSIFYDRSDVQFISIHGDTDVDFPYFLGAKDEVGEGEGHGFNINMPLPKGTGWQDWSEALDHALVQVGKFKPDFLVISLGVDTFEGDPISFFKLKTSEFCLIGERLKSAAVPTLFIFEGGYAVAELGINCLNVLTSFES